MKKKNGCLIALLVFLVVIVISFIIFVTVALKLGASSSASTSSAAMTESLLETIVGCTSEQSDAITQILVDCGIVLEGIEHDDGLDHDGMTGYRMKTAEVKNVILYLNADKSVAKVKYADYELYNGTKTNSVISDYYLTQEESIKLNGQCIDYVKKVLKSPSSAKFPSLSEWRMSKVEGVITIQSYVDADNAFGANLRSVFQIVLTDGAVSSFIFDGKELIAQKE